MKLRRYATLAGLALGPVLVLAVFFVLPVSGMVGRGFVVDGRFGAGGVLDVLARPRTHRVLWFTVWSAGLATLASVVLGVHELLAQSEKQQKTEFAMRIAQVMRDVDLKRTADLNNVRMGMGKIDATVTEEAAAHRALMNYILTNPDSKK